MNVNWQNSKEYTNAGLNRRDQRLETSLLLLAELKPYKVNSSEQQSLRTLRNSGPRNSAIDPRIAFGDGTPGPAELRSHVGPHVRGKGRRRVDRVADARRRTLPQSGRNRPRWLPLGDDGFGDGRFGGTQRAGPKGLRRQHRDEVVVPSPGAKRRRPHVHGERLETRQR